MRLIPPSRIPPRIPAIKGQQDTDGDQHDERSCGRDEQKSGEQRHRRARGGFSSQPGSEQARNAS